MTANTSTDIRVRAPGRDDMQVIVDLVVACDLVDLGAPDFSLDTLEEEWAHSNFTLERDAWLMEAPDAGLLAYGSLESRNGGAQLNSVGFVHPEQRRRGLGSQLLTLQEGRARERVDSAPDGVRVVFQAWKQGRAPAERLFARHGLEHVRSNWRMLIEMAEAPPKPQWPDGITVRSWTEDADRAVHAANEEAFADHWGHTPDDPYEEWQQGRENMSRFDADLWLLAMSGDEIAGVCLCTYFLDQGYVQDLSVRRPWRKQGLGLALLHEAFGRFWARGTKNVGLGVDSQNLTGATRLYKRAGMHVRFQFDRYEKELRPGREIRNLG